LESRIKKILVAEERISTSQFLKNQLKLLGYEVFLVNNGKDALFIFTREDPDIVLLNANLPKIDGYEVCSKIRENSRVPIIMLSPFSNISDRILGLELGADDYLIKPFSPRELESRIKSILRRSNLQNKISPKKRQQNIQLGNLFIDMSTRIGSRGRTKIKLSNIEYSILELLIENAGKKLSRTMILENIWGYKPERFIDTRIVDVHISRLRSKIEENPSNPDLIITARGSGYIFHKY
jgi:OmpR family response regulator RpaB